MSLVIYHVDTAEHGDIEIDVSGGSVYLTADGKGEDDAYRMSCVYRKLTAVEALKLGTALIDCGIALMDTQESVNHMDPVDLTELIAAAEDALLRGHHDGPCDNQNIDDACSFHVATAGRRDDRLRAALKQVKE